MYLSAETWSPMIFHDRNINNEQTQNFNQIDTVSKSIVDIIPYRMSTFVLISIFRFLKPFPLTFVSNLVFYSEFLSVRG